MWSYGTWIFIYSTNVPMICVFITNKVYVLESCTWQSILDTTLCDQINQWSVAVWWFSSGASQVRGKRFTVCTEITIILGTVRFTIRGGCLRYKWYNAHFLKKSSVELPISSFGDHLINILRKVNRLIYAFKIN